MLSLFFSGIVFKLYEYEEIMKQQKLMDGVNSSILTIFESYSGEFQCFSIRAS